MIKKEDLKKGDMILIVPNSDYTRNTSVSKAEVIAIGSKFITVAVKWDDGHYGISSKFYNDDRMSEKDYSSRRLFLGTEEEYEESKKLEKKARELYYEINETSFRDIGYDKLKAIKTIIEADSLDNALAKMHCVRLPQ